MGDEPNKRALKELEEKTAEALAMGGPEKLAQRKAQGHLNARERIDYLVDADSFAETGRHARSIRAEVRHKTPADGKVAGFARIDAREAGHLAVGGGLVPHFRADRARVAARFREAVRVHEVVDAFARVEMPLRLALRELLRPAHRQRFGSFLFQLFQRALVRLITHFLSPVTRHSSLSRREFLHPSPLWPTWSSPP